MFTLIKYSLCAWYFTCAVLFDPHGNLAKMVIWKMKRPNFRGVKSLAQGLTGSMVTAEY